MINNHPIDYATAIYTGGGIYIYHGRIANGHYFMLDDDTDLPAYFDANPDDYWDECTYPDWQDEHLVGFGEDPDFKYKVLDYIIKNNPCGNFSIDELEERKADLRNYMERKKATYNVTALIARYVNLLESDQPKYQIEEDYIDLIIWAYRDWTTNKGAKIVDELCGLIDSEELSGESYTDARELIDEIEAYWS